MTLNLGNIPDKQYFLSGQYEVPKHLTKPSHDNEWANPDIHYIVHGTGQIILLQEAWGFEEGGPIEAWLHKCGCQVKYYQEGNAPPLACLAKGPSKEQLNSAREAAKELSGQDLDTGLYVDIAIVESRTIPWGGTAAFCNENLQFTQTVQNQIRDGLSPLQPSK